MSDQSDVFQYLLNESPDAKNADLFSFGPPPQPPDAPSPELFDQDVDQDVAELDLNLSFDDFLSTVCDNVPAASTLPALTYSTDSCYEIASSLDFYINAPSVPLMPSEIETVTCGSVNDGSYTTHGSIYSPAAVLSDGLLPFPPPIQSRPSPTVGLPMFPHPSLSTCPNTRWCKSRPRPTMVAQ